METILLLAHTEADGIAGQSRRWKLWRRRWRWAATLTVGLVGAATQAAADQIAGCGAARFLAVTGEAFGQPRYATDAAAAEALCRAAGCQIVIAAGTLAVGARAARRGLPARRARGHARHRSGGGRTACRR